MIVCRSDEKLLIFAFLISPSKSILFENEYQTFDTVFQHQMKHLEFRQKYPAARRIFNSSLLTNLRQDLNSRGPYVESQTDEIQGMN